MNRPPACTYLLVRTTCLLLVRSRGVWSKIFHIRVGVFGRRFPHSSRGVWSCKTTQNHRILWKTSGMDEPKADVGLGELIKALDFLIGP